MGRGRTAVRNEPLAAPAQQRGLFLRTGNRQAQVGIVAMLAEGRCTRGVAQQAGNVRVIGRTALDDAKLFGHLAFGQQLQRAHAVAAQRRE
ncbi:hypothetical protein D3C86_1489740 [compost metagenome]